MKDSGPLRVLRTDLACCFRRCQIISAVAGRGRKARDVNESEAGRCSGSDGAERGRRRGMVNSCEGQSLGRGEADSQSRGEGGGGGVPPADNSKCSTAFHLGKSHRPTLSPCWSRRQDSVLMLG